MTPGEQLSEETLNEFEKSAGEPEDRYRLAWQLGECCKAIRRLQSENEELKRELINVKQQNEDVWKSRAAVCIELETLRIETDEGYSALRQVNGDLTAKLDTAMQVIKNDCDNDEAIRALISSSTKIDVRGDTYYVPSLEDLVESILKELQSLREKNEQLYALIVKHHDVMVQPELGKPCIVCAPTDHPR